MLRSKRKNLFNRNKEKTEKFKEELNSLHTELKAQFEKLKAAGIRDIVVNIHHFPDMIINYLKDNEFITFKMLGSNQGHGISSLGDKAVCEGNTVTAYNGIGELCCFSGRKPAYYGIPVF